MCSRCAWQHPQVDKAHEEAQQQEARAAAAFEAAAREKAEASLPGIPTALEANAAMSVSRRRRSPKRMNSTDRSPRSPRGPAAAPADADADADAGATMSARPPRQQLGCLKTRVWASSFKKSI